MATVTFYKINTICSTDGWQTEGKTWISGWSSKTIADASTQMHSSATVYIPLCSVACIKKKWADPVDYDFVSRWRKRSKWFWMRLHCWGTDGSKDAQLAGVWMGSVTSAFKSVGKISVNRVGGCSQQRTADERDAQKQKSDSSSGDWGCQCRTWSDCVSSNNRQSCTVGYVSRAAYINLSLQGWMLVQSSVV